MEGTNMATTLRQKLFGGWMGKKPSQTPPESTTTVFLLQFGDLTIGRLSAQAGKWIFEYTDEFRKQTELRPIVAFPDLNRRYESPELWPFFAMRVPSLKQTAVQNVIEHDRIDSNDEVELLKRFGRKTVSNPFVLQEAK